MGTVQITAKVSQETREAFDRYSDEHGLKKNHVVEQALLFYMRSRQEMPEEAFVPGHIVLTGDAFEALTASLEEPEATPTDALTELMSGR